MSLRVTNKNLMDNYMNNMQLNLRSLMKYQNQMATGKEITKPSDDPYKVVKAISLESVLSKNEQYKKNIADAQGWMDMTDASMQEMITVMNRFKGQIIQAGSAMSSEGSKVSIAAEMEQNIERIIQVGNTTFEGRYIFGGFITDKAPFEIKPDNQLAGTATDLMAADGQIVREIAPSVQFPINVTATRVLNGGAGDDLGVTMQKIHNTIYPSDPQKTPNFIYQDDATPPTLSGNLPEGATFQEQLDYGMQEIERHFDNMISIVAEVGAKQNRLESALDRNMSQTLSTVELLSKTEDIDYVDKITQYKSRQNTYDAALASGGKLLQMSLISYLK